MSNLIRIKHIIAALLVAYVYFYSGIAEATTKHKTKHKTAKHKSVPKKNLIHIQNTFHDNSNSSDEFSVIHEGDTADYSEIDDIVQSTMTKTNTSNAYPTTTNTPAEATSIEKRVVSFVAKTVSDLHYSSYKLGGSRFDPSKGVYILDCSNYVDHILQVIYPHAYSRLVNSTGAGTPNSRHYYDFISRLSEDSKYCWNKIRNVDQLRPGDVLVFRYKNPRGHQTGGHVMLVMDKPLRDIDTYLVRVADSAPNGHSEDTRLRHVSGIGIGTLLLKVNPQTGQPTAYAWRFGSHWKNNVYFAMARPAEIT